MDYISLNRRTWNRWADINYNSDFYDMSGFLKGETSLKEIELDLLGDIKGKKILHLQCHFGQDSLSLARMGAKVTGVDLSPNAIEKANELNAQLGLDATFICCNLYELEQHLDDEFDIVFTTYGTISWLPELDAWAALIAKYLKPEGQFVFAEFHPVVWMFDDDFTQVAYHYHNAEPIKEENEGNYADPNSKVVETCVCWNHGLGEVLSSLIKAGIEIEIFREHDYSPFPAFNKTIEIAPGKYHVKPMAGKIPLVYSLSGKKKN